MSVRQANDETVAADADTVAVERAAPRVSRLRAVQRAVSRRLVAVPLRVTLVIALVLLTSLGMLVSGVAVTSSMHRILIDRVDQQVNEAIRGFANPSAPPPEHLPHRSGMERPPSLFYVRVEDPSGAVRFQFGANASVPDVPLSVGRHPKTVGSVGNPDEHWRAARLVNSDGSSVVALRLTDTQNIVDRMIGLELVVGAIVLVALVLAAQLVIRRSLRPLLEVEKTASAIAGGDLHRRVPMRGTNTEVDLLSQSLNGMLSQIQQAFATTEASEEAALRSEARMRRFVADASHELRTPLTTIKGFAELYRQGALANPEMFMNRIEREANRMSLLVEDLLMLARLDAQRPLDRRPVDLLALASDAVHNARAVDTAQHPDGPPRPIGIEICSGAGTLEVSGDEARLRQVLGNLLNNALIHTPHEAAVTVRLTPEPDEVLVEIADTGPGLPPDQADRVFERFYRTDASRSRDSGGTGLGLSIVQALVSAHGGRVGVSSVPGEGTVFAVHLPREAP